MSNQPIRRTQARNLERQRALQQAQHRHAITLFLPFVIAAAAVLFVGISVFVLTNRTVSGTPRIQVDQERIDLGDRIFNQPVRGVLNVKNVGEGTLKLETPRVADVLEGC